MNNRQIGQSLAVLSVALGAAEFFASKRIARTLGVEKHKKIVKAFGVREIATGAALATWPAKSAGAWARAGGDVLDLAALGAAWNARNARSKPIIASVAFVAAALAADIAAGVYMGRAERA